MIIQLLPPANQTAAYDIIYAYVVHSHYWLDVAEDW